MAKFVLEMPTDVMNDLEKISKDADKIFGKMTQAGAEAVERNMKASAPKELVPYIKTTRVYKTPTDGGINTKVYISGYIPFSDPNRKYFSRSNGSGKTVRTSDGVPADFLAKVYEYGRSNAPFPKRSFMRKSFRKSDIEDAMLKAQIEASGGILE